MTEIDSQVGSTGNSTEPHLHAEFNANANVVTEWGVRCEHVDEPDPWLNGPIDETAARAAVESFNRRPQQGHQATLLRRTVIVGDWEAVTT